MEFHTLRALAVQRIYELRGSSMQAFMLIDNCRTSHGRKQMSLASFALD
jgi:hypothetical protein